MEQSWSPQEGGHGSFIWMGETSELSGVLHMKDAPASISRALTGSGTAEGLWGPGWLILKKALWHMQMTHGKREGLGSGTHNTCVLKLLHTYIKVYMYMCVHRCVPCTYGCVSLYTCGCICMQAICTHVGLLTCGLCMHVSVHTVYVSAHMHGQIVQVQVHVERIKLDTKQEGISCLVSILPGF